MSSEPGPDAAAIVDQVLARAGLRPDADDRERLIRVLPRVLEIAALLRRIPIDDAEPAVRFNAAEASPGAPQE